MEILFGRIVGGAFLCYIFFSVFATIKNMSILIKNKTKFDEVDVEEKNEYEILIHPLSKKQIERLKYVTKISRSEGFTLSLNRLENQTLELNKK